MKSARLSVPIFGVIARTKKAKEFINADELQKWARMWQSVSDTDSWWINKEVGVAIFRPEITIESGGKNAVLAVRGNVAASGRQQPPASWSQLSKAATGTTAILYDFLERDTTAIRNLRGQFALAFWDGYRRRLILARDHLGQRSMFIRTTPELIVFCSELSPLLRLPDTNCQLDYESAFWYLAFGTPAPGRTLARNVERLPAAHLYVWEENSLPFIQRYWTPLKADAARQTSHETISDLRNALDSSISLNLNYDSLQGILLSGGVDSTYIAATAKLLKVSDLHAFTSVFEPQHSMNETEYAAAVARWLNIEHHIVPLYAEEAFELMESVVFTLAEPCSAWASLTHFRILALVHQMGISHVLSGLGADEIFGGYDHYRAYYARFLRSARRNQSLSGLDDFTALLLPEEQKSRRVLYPGVARFFDDPSLRNALHEPFSAWQYASHLRDFYRECRRLKPEAQVMEMMVAYECQHRIPDLLFANFESISRRMEINVSYPFLNPDLVQSVAGLEIESRYRNSRGQFSLKLSDLQPRFKYAMMQIASSRIPREICERPRKSYTAPFGGWFFEPKFNRRLLEKLARSSFWEQRFVKREWLDRILRNVVPGPNPWIFQLWALSTLIGWHDRFVEPPEF